MFGMFIEADGYQTTIMPLISNNTSSLKVHGYSINVTLCWCNEFIRALSWFTRTPFTISKGFYTIVICGHWSYMYVSTIMPTFSSNQSQCRLAIIPVKTISWMTPRHSIASTARLAAFLDRSWIDSDTLPTSWREFCTLPTPPLVSCCC